MDDEKRNYSVIGTVSIGTDEYRDLIEAVKNAEAKLEKKESEYWEQYRKTNKAEVELKDIKEKYSKYSDFISGSEEIKAKYKLWLIEKQTAEVEAD